MEDSEDKLFNNDPIYMKSLVGKEVEIETIENQIYNGKVYVIDPVYKTAVLYIESAEKDKTEAVIIMHHAIKSFKVLSNSADEEYLKIEEAIPPDDTQDNKIILKKWLKHMFINVVECGDNLKIEDHLVIMPPYGLENCICNNTIILERIRNIMKLMPPDFS